MQFDTIRIENKKHIMGVDMKLFHYSTIAISIYCGVATVALIGEFMANHTVQITNNTDGNIEVNIGLLGNTCNGQIMPISSHSTKSINVGSCCISKIQVTGNSGSIANKTITKQYCKRAPGGLGQVCKPTESCINMKLIITQTTDNELTIQ